MNFWTDPEDFTEFAVFYVSHIRRNLEPVANLMLRSWRWSNAFTQQLRAR